MKSELRSRTNVKSATSGLTFQGREQKLVKGDEQMFPGERNPPSGGNVPGGT